jgi:hypothetical protein
VAGTFSGIPSTGAAVLHGRPVLEATRAAGSLLGRPGVVRGGLAHAGLSLAWAAVLSIVLPPRREPFWGALGGAGIALVDLGLARGRWPAVAALPTAPQVADHLAFGALVGAVFAHDRRVRSGRRASGPTRS